MEVSPRSELHVAVLVDFETSKGHITASLSDRRYPPVRHWNYK